MKKGFLLFNFVLLLGSKGIFLYIEPHSKSLIYTILVFLSSCLWSVEVCCCVAVAVWLRSLCWLDQGAVASACLSVYCTVSMLT